MRSYCEIPATRLLEIIQRYRSNRDKDIAAQQQVELANHKKELGSSFWFWRKPKEITDQEALADIQQQNKSARYWYDQPRYCHIGSEYEDSDKIALALERACRVMSVVHVSVEDLDSIYTVDPEHFNPYRTVGE